MDPIDPYQPPTAEIPEIVTNALDMPLASPWIRLGAQLIDTVILLIVVVPVMFLTGYIERAMNARTAGAGPFAMLGEQLLFSLIGVVIYIAIHWVFLQKGQTIGKRLLSIRIVRKNGTPCPAGRIILYRFLPVQLVAMIPCGGLLAIIDALMIFRSGRNTLHDDIADTMVVTIPPGT